MTAATAPRPSRSTRLLRSLLDRADVGAEVATTERLGIGTAGLNARGYRDEDGTHTRIQLDDGRSFIFREYATTTRAAAIYQAKEEAVFRMLRAAGLPAPDVLASERGSTDAERLPAATLLSGTDGDPLEEVFLTVAGRDRERLWSTVGGMLRRLHDIDVGDAEFLRAPGYQRPWTKFLPYFFKSLKGVVSERPDLKPTVADLRKIQRPLSAYLDTRPRAICCCGAGGHLPGMLVRQQGRSWECAAWLNLGYYVSIDDPARDVALIAVSHREWTGDDVPSSFYREYGYRPDRVVELLYEANLQLGRGAAYLRGKRRAGWGPPPHSRAVEALDAFPEAVAQLRSLLAR